MFKGVIFDMDGTLVDSESVTHRVWMDYMKEFDVQFPLDDYKKFVGSGYHMSVGEWLKTTHNLSISIEDMYSEKKTRLKQAYLDELEPMFYAIEAINFFANNEIQMAVATSSNTDVTHLKINKFGLTEHFSSVLCLEDVNQKKPHPEIYHKSIQNLGLKSEECMVFEDTLTGVKAAKAAGCFTIAIPNPHTAHLDFSIADKVFNNFKEAIIWLKESKLSDL